MIANVTRFEMLIVVSCILFSFPYRSGVGQTSSSNRDCLCRYQPPTCSVVKLFFASKGPCSRKAIGLRLILGRGPAQESSVWRGMIFVG